MERSAQPEGEPTPTLLGRIGSLGILAAFALANAALAIAPPAPPRVSLSAHASALALELETEVDAALGLLGPLRGRLRAGDADWKAFDDLVARSPLRRPTQELVAWVPRVSGKARPGFEADSGRDAFRSLRIVEPGRGDKGTVALVTAQTRAHHHPVALAAPLQPGAELLGLDLAATPELELALSRSSERPTLVGPLTLLPADVCASLPPGRAGCAAQIFVVLPVAGERGALLVGLSWSALGQAALARAIATARPLDPLQPRTARARFHVQRTPFSLELRAEPGRPLTARLGRALGETQAQ
jgi:hypothetical protein